MKPKINKTPEYIEIVGHYDDSVLCAKLTLLADLYAIEHREGYAKFRIEDEDKLDLVNEKLDYRGMLSIYSNNGQTLLSNLDYSFTTCTITSTGTSIDGMGHNYTYSGSQTFLGFSITPNATVPDSDLEVGDSFSIDSNKRVYIVEGSSVTDLTGTKWLLNSSPDLSIKTAYELNFVSKDTNYIYFAIATSPNPREPIDRRSLAYCATYYNSRTVYSAYRGDWVDEVYRTIEITGGGDARNPDLIAWLQANAVQQVEPEPTETNTFSIGNLSIANVYVGLLQAKKVYLGNSLVWESGSEPPAASYEIGFRGMSNSTPALTRTGQAVGATWAATSGVISIDGIDLTKIFGGYVGNDGEKLTWDGATLKYLHKGTPYTGNVFVKIKRFFAKAHYENNVLDGYDLCFAPSAPDNTYQDWFLGKDHCIIGCYKARGGGFSNGLQSKQGLSYTSATTANEIVTAYRLNSSTAYSLHEKWYNENAILQVLFMALFATRQTEDVFPQATYRHSTNDTRATGYMDSYRVQSLFAYEPTGDSGKRGNMFLGIEDFVGWGYELVAGVVLSGTNVCSTLDYANFAYSNTYTADLTLPSSDNYITQLQESANNAGLLVPKSITGGSATTYFCDYQWHVGNCWYQGADSPYADVGLFFFLGVLDALYSDNFCAARLCGTPI